MTSFPECQARAYSGRFHNVYLFVTERCQLRCGHCYMGDRLERGLYFETDRAILTLEYWYRMGGRFLTLVGGEPTLHPGLSRIIDAANTVGYEKVMIDTNALRPDELLKISPSSLYYARISLDGASPETHDRVRGSGSYERTIAGIRSILAAGFSVRLTTTIFNFNQHEAIAVVHLAHLLGIKVVNFHSFTPEGRGSANADWSMSPTEWYEFWKKLESELGDCPVEVRIPPSWATRDDLPSLSQHGFQGCIGCSLDRISVFPDGRCYTCSLMFDYDVNVGEMGPNGFQLNTTAKTNEFEMFTSAAMQAADILSMGCPAEKLLGLDEESLNGLIPICRLWRKSIRNTK